MAVSIQGNKLSQPGGHILDCEAIGPHPELPIGFKVNGKYEIVKLLGEGGFGAVYQVHHTKRPQLPPMALKVEWMSAPFKVLQMELIVMMTVKKKTRKHILRCFNAGSELTTADKFHWITMAMAGRSLSGLRRDTPHCRFTRASTVRLALQCIEGIKELHDVGFLHRDVKPSNFCIGRTPEDIHTVYLIDLGLCRQYKRSSGTLRPPRKKAAFRGTVRYASPSAHQEKELGRADDLISLVYMLVEMVVGQLPWRNKTDKNEVYELKQSTGDNLFTHHCPPQFAQIMKILTHVHYSDPPPYAELTNCLDTVMKERGYSHNDPFDWEEGGLYFQHTRYDILKAHNKHNSDKEKSMNKSITNAYVAEGENEDKTNEEGGNSFLAFLEKQMG